MLSSLRKRIDNDEDGFTLIELMVVVLIIAILIAIAIPTFLGVQNRAKDRAAQSDLRNAATIAKTIATDDSGSMALVTAALLGTTEGSLTFAAAGTTDVIGVVKSADVGTDDAVTLYKESESGEWFGVSVSRTGQVGFCTGSEAVVSAEPALGIVGGQPDKLTACNATKW